MNLQLWHDDCLAIMPTLADGSIDLLLTDPPYGTTALPWDQAIDYSTFWAQAHRVVKPTGIIAVFCAQPMATDLINANRRHFRYDLIWHKTMPVGFLDANRRPLRAHENIFIFCQRWRGARNRLLSTYNPQFTDGTPYVSRHGGVCALYGTKTQRQARQNTDGRRHPVSVLTYPRETTGRFHPTQKPLPLLRWLIQTYSHPGETVLDPFMGSGNTGMAALGLGRQFLGIERDSAYYTSAWGRLNALHFDVTAQRSTAMHESIRSHCN